MRGDSARPGKRPLRALSASEKMEAIQRVHEGESKASVARDIGVPESTLRGWCKSEHKIRGMARNSSTPDSEAHSPASSSGANPLTMTGASNLSSEDEAVVGPTSAKKMKLEPLNAGCSLNDNGEPNDLKHEVKPKMDYVSSIINSLVASGVRSENSSILLQQLGLLSSAQSAANLTKNLLNLSTGSLGSPHLGATQTVGLVENGLQYTKSTGGNGQSKRSSSHISAIAPTQLDSVSKSVSRKSLPPAAEAPSTPVPASPRKTNEHHNGALGLQQQLHSRSSKKDNGCTSSSARKADEALWLWLAQQQQQLLGHQTAASFNPSASGVDGSWFWQWYKQCSFPMMAAAPMTPPTSQHPTASAHLSKKSPSKAKAMLDTVLSNNNNTSNNNNENVRRSLNVSSSGRDLTTGNNNNNNNNNGINLGVTEVEDETETGQDMSVASTEEAIEHGEKFFKWLDKCSEPSVTRLQIMQFKYLLDNLKTCRKKTSSLKHSRK